MDVLKPLYVLGDAAWGATEKAQLMEDIETIVGQKHRIDPRSIPPRQLDTCKMLDAALARLLERLPKIRERLDTSSRPGRLESRKQQRHRTRALQLLGQYWTGVVRGFDYYEGGETASFDATELSEAIAVAGTLHHNGMYSGDTVTLNMHLGRILVAESVDGHDTFLFRAYDEHKELGDNDFVKEYRLNRYIGYLETRGMTGGLKGFDERAYELLPQAAFDSPERKLRRK